jgi:C-terminal processing protease CtpA/Prc
LPGSPAAEAGLSDGQIIRRIGDLATVDKPLAQCAPLIRGPEGTQLSLEVSDAEGNTRRVALTRQKIKL